MQRYTNNVQDGFGNAIGSVTVTVRRVSDGGLATIFSDNGVTGKTNPFTNDPDGEFFFYAADDRYNIFFTGPITDQTDDVILQDSGAFGPTLRIRTDIVTATPPSTEAVQGRLEIVDLDSTDFLADFGFTGGNTLRIHNFMHGGNFEIVAEDVGTVARFILVGDPDGNTSIYNQGVLRLQAASGGDANVRSNDSVDTSTRQLSFAHADGTQRGLVGQIAAVTYLRSLINGSPVRLEGRDTGAVLRTMIDADPDNSVNSYYNGTLRMRTLNAGAVEFFSDGSTDTEVRQLILSHANSTDRASFGHTTASDLLNINNLIAGGNIQINATDAGSTSRVILIADPDALTTLRGDTDVHIQVTAGADTAIICHSLGRVQLRYNDVETFRTADQTATDKISGADVLGADGTFQPVGLGVIIDDPTAFGSGAQTPFNQINAHQTIEHNETVATSYTTHASTGASQTDIPAGAQWEVKNTNTGALTILGGTGVTLTWFDGGGGVPPTGTRTLARAGRCVVRKISDTNYEIWGNGLT